MDRLRLMKGMLEMMEGVDEIDIKRKKLEETIQKQTKIKEAEEEELRTRSFQLSLLQQQLQKEQERTLLQQQLQKEREQTTTYENEEEEE